MTVIVYISQYKFRLSINISVVDDFFSYQYVNRPMSLLVSSLTRIKKHVVVISS